MKKIYEKQNEVKVPANQKKGRDDYKKERDNKDKEK